MKFYIHLEDECPRIGSGWRIVKLKSCGYKWANIYYEPLNKNAKLKRPVWNSIMKTAKPMERTIQ